MLADVSSRTTSGPRRRRLSLAGAWSRVGSVRPAAAAATPSLCSWPTLPPDTSRPQAQAHPDDVLLPPLLRVGSYHASWQSPAALAIHSLSSRWRCPEKAVMFVPFAAVCTLASRVWLVLAFARTGEALKSSCQSAIVNHRLENIKQQQNRLCHEGN